MRVLLLVGFSLLTLGFVWLFITTALIRTGVPTAGTVQANIARGRGYATRIEFSTQEGEQFSFVTLGSTNPPRYAIGESVPVFYDPKEPSRAMIASLFDIAFGPGMLLLAGGINLSFGGYFLWRQKSFLVKGA